MVDDLHGDAARRALARNWPHLVPSDPKYVAFSEVLASFHRQFGNESFELRYNLRPPKNRAEIWQSQYISGLITEEELSSRLKTDAERPIDLEMLAAFNAAYEERLSHYSCVLTKSVINPSDAGSSVIQVNETEIEHHIAAMDETLPLWKENLRTVFEFLEELRITTGRGLLQLMSFEATSAHWLAHLIFNRMIQGWQSCRKISDRSRTDSRYLYEATAIELFNSTLFSTLPSPQSIRERLREEFVLARAALKNSLGHASESTSNVSQKVAIVSDSDWLIDNESRELILIGEFSAIIGKAGHIFRPIANCDWGIDGEIEFKNELGHATGSRLYVQLKSGDSYLTHRISDRVEVFTVKNLRHLSYWTQQAYPVMLVIRQSTGIIRWMDVSEYLQRVGLKCPQIIFNAEAVTPAKVRELADKLLRPNSK